MSDKINLKEKTGRFLNLLSIPLSSITVMQSIGVSIYKLIMPKTKKQYEHIQGLKISPEKIDHRLTLINGEKDPVPMLGKMIYGELFGLVYKQETYVAPDFQAHSITSYYADKDVIKEGLKNLEKAKENMLNDNIKAKIKKKIKV